MMNFLITAVGLLMISQSDGDNQRAIGSVVAGAGLVRSLSDLDRGRSGGHASI